MTDGECPDCKRSLIPCPSPEGGRGFPLPSGEGKGEGTPSECEINWF